MGTSKAKRSQAKLGGQVGKDFRVVQMPVGQLRPHPRNYREHPDDQLAHIEASLRAHGFYRNVVAANDGTVLAGHGVLKAAKKLGLAELPVVTLPIGPDDPVAIQVMVGDNEIGALAEVNDRVLTDLLKEFRDRQENLLGTGFNDEQLAALALVTRNRDELADFSAAAAWVGLPGYETGSDDALQLVVSFKTEDDRARFVEQHKLRIDIRAVKRRTWSTRWPWTDREDKAAFAFQEEPARGEET